MIISIFLLSLLATAYSDEECVHRDYGNTGTVCVCNADYCDTISPVEKLPSNQYVLYTSNLEGLRFSKQVGDFEISSKSTKNTATINHDIKYQTIHGFGGAFTDSAGININSLNDQAKEHLLRSYFSDEGIEYNVARVPIGGSDFSTRAYTYLDTEEPDTKMENFTLQNEDFVHKIPLIKRANDLSGNKLNLFASAWTAPKWMKTNNEYAGVGFLKEEMYQAWVDYFVKFLDLYKQEGIDFWGITTGNEPSLVVFSFKGINTVGWFPWTVSKWIKNNLGPTLRNSQHSDIKIIVHDDQRPLLPLLYGVFEDEEVRQYVDGIGVHWYLNKAVPATWLTQVHNRYPEKFILGTEACSGYSLFEKHVKLGSWERGQDYAEDIILDLQNWGTGWVDWNMALNETGGPTYIDNVVDSPIIVNATGGEFYKQPMFYALGHFSKFVLRESIRIEVPNTYDKLYLVAFDRPDGGTVIVVINKEETNIPLSLGDEQRGIITTEITAKSFNTILYW